ncbi:MAG: DUF3540 domain-containing protein [Deltaproteobacteria bacterium]|nr:DUF3540 domain-containing protein [Deltaproteobacteria bacterium]
MREPQELKDHPQPCLEYGAVVKEGPLPVVEICSGTFSAQRALSCLVNPRRGDSVLVSFDSGGTCFILSVLMRSPLLDSGHEILVTGDMRLHVQKGSLNITADEGVSLASKRVSVAAKVGEATLESFSFMGSVLSAQVESIRTVAGKVENIFHRLTERFIDVFRFVRDHEEIQTGSTRYLVETNLTMHSKNAMHVAEEIVTINAEQVHLG